MVRAGTLCAYEDGAEAGPVYGAALYGAVSLARM